jgi:hypothetical protein
MEKAMVDTVVRGGNHDAAPFTPTLPAELWRMIFKHSATLDFSSIQNISLTCKSFAFHAQPLLCHTIYAAPVPSSGAYERQLQKLQWFTQPRFSIEVKRFSARPGIYLRKRSVSEMTHTIPSVDYYRDMWLKFLEALPSIRQPDIRHVFTHIYNGRRSS